MYVALQTGFVEQGSTYFGFPFVQRSCKYLYLIAGGGSYGGHRRSGGYYEGGGGGGRRGYDDGGRRHEMSPPSKRMRGNDWYVGVLFRVKI